MKAQPYRYGQQREDGRRGRLLSSTALERSRKLPMVVFYLRAHDRFAKPSRTEARRP